MSEWETRSGRWVMGEWGMSEWVSGRWDVDVQTLPCPRHPSITPSPRHPLSPSVHHPLSPLTSLSSPAGQTYEFRLRFLDFPIFLD
jgi:hypothetical protein